MIALRFNGGPLDGTTAMGDEWPPPDNLMVETARHGLYVKSSQSQLPDEVADHPNLMRGAEYQWEEVGADAQAQ